MRTRHGFARHFLLLGATFAAGLLVGGVVVSVRASPAPAVVATPVPYPPSKMVREGRTLELRKGRLLERRYDPEHVWFESMWPDAPEIAGMFADEIRGATFTECDFRGADLSDLDLRKCCFWECDLRGAKFARANLTGAYYTVGTKWPAGFDPEAHGARLEE